MTFLKRPGLIYIGYLVFALVKISIPAFLYPAFCLKHNVEHGLTTYKKAGLYTLDNFSMVSRSGNSFFRGGGHPQKQANLTSNNKLY